MEKVCIIGSLNNELILGPIDQLPDWGKQVFVNEMDLQGAGSAARVAFPLAKLGVKSILLGCVGNDRSGEGIIETIKSYDLKIDGVEVIEGYRTGICLSLRKKNGERLYISHLGALACFDETHITMHDELIQNAGYILLTGYFVLPGLRGKAALNIFKKARGEGKITMLDTGWDPDNWQKETVGEVLSLLKYVDIFIPNSDEASALTKTAHIEEMACKLSTCGPATVIIKQGVKGSLAKTRKGFFVQKVFPTNVVNTTAAGEAFNAGVIYGLVNRMEMEDILKFSNALASLVISRAFIEYPTLKEVKRLMENGGL